MGTISDLPEASKYTATAGATLSIVGCLAMVCSSWWRVRRGDRTFGLTAHLVTCLALSDLFYSVNLVGLQVRRAERSARSGGGRGGSAFAAVASVALSSSRTNVSLTHPFSSLSPIAAAAATSLSLPLSLSRVLHSRSISCCTSCRRRRARGGEFWTISSPPRRSAGPQWSPSISLISPAARQAKASLLHAMSGSGKLGTMCASTQRARC